MCSEQYSARVEFVVAFVQARPFVKRVNDQLLQLRACNFDQIRGSVSIFDEY